MTPHTCNGTCADDHACASQLRHARAETLRLHWWNVALCAARRYHAATTVHERTLAFRALRRVPRRTAEMALYREAMP